MKVETLKKPEDFFVLEWLLWKLLKLSALKKKKNPFKQDLIFFP